MLYTYSTHAWLQLQVSWWCEVFLPVFKPQVADFFHVGGMVRSLCLPLKNIGLCHKEEDDVIRLQVCMHGSNYRFAAWCEILPVSKPEVAEFSM
jgi:hypothetical protein